MGAGVAEAGELSEEAAPARRCEQVHGELVEGSLALDDDTGLGTLQLVVTGQESGPVGAEAYRDRPRVEGGRVGVPDDEVVREDERFLFALINEDQPLVPQAGPS